MSIKSTENADLKKLMDWHLKQANQSPAEREFHIWAVTLISIVRETR